MYFCRIGAEIRGRFWNLIRFLYFCTKFGTLFKFKIMAVIQVTSREFRDNQAALFGLADKGERVIIRRRKKPSYILTTVNDDDFFLSAEAEARLELSRKQYLSGETTVCKTAEDAIKHLEML